MNTGVFPKFSPFLPPVLKVAARPSTIASSCAGQADPPPHASSPQMRPKALSPGKLTLTFEGDESPELVRVEFAHSDLHDKDGAPRSVPLIAQKGDFQWREGPQ